jgi:maleate isomerase
MIPFHIERRVGIVAPPTNPSVEPELHALLPQHVALHATRLPLLQGDLQARLAGFHSCFEACLVSFGDLAIDAFFIGVTGSTYDGGFDADRALCERLSDLVAAPVRTASLAIVDALTALGIRKITLLSPYPNWLTERSVRYWQSAGIDVENVAAITNASSPDAHVYTLSSEDVTEALRRLPVDTTTVLMTGTGLVTLPTILSSAAATSLPLLLSSNLCGAWWLTRELGLPPSDCLRAACAKLGHVASD